MVARRQSASVQSSLRDRDDGGMGVVIAESCTGWKTESGAKWLARVEKSDLNADSFQTCACA